MSALVSVRVIAYNSSKTIIETLDSIYNQTYPNLELIISDDCSKDDTVAVCREWLNEHAERFARTEILTVEKNTGVSANINRAERACRGVWIKGIAGDDMLMPNCIEDCMEYVAAHPDTIYLFGKCKAFGASQERCREIDNLFDYTFFEKTNEEQLRRLMVGNCLPATAVFYHAERAKATGVTNDERIPMIEDWPKWINLVKAGVRLGFVDKVIVKYRVSEASLSTGTKKPKAFDISMALFYQLYIYSYECEHGNRKAAIENWLRAQNTIKEKWYWYAMFKLYKFIVMHKLH